MDKQINPQEITSYNQLRHIVHFLFKKLGLPDRPGRVFSDRTTGVTLDYASWDFALQLLVVANSAYYIVNTVAPTYGIVVKLERTQTIGGVWKDKAVVKFPDQTKREKSFNRYIDALSYATRQVANYVSRSESKGKSNNA